ncbi:peptide chain release factor 2 [Dehalobacterium formicoaceticum]|uniref:peptide chain release factor 2 n=1 Tax=Dehalobacterium formicoaceticum TaxID=51515 RepID=UPI0031F6BC76
MLEELKKDIEEAENRLEELRVSLDILQKEKEIKELEELTLGAGFWDEREEAQKVLQRVNYLKERIKIFTQLANQFEDMKILWELGMEENDESVEGEVMGQLKGWMKELSSLELEVLLSGPYDSHSAIIALHAGAGGTEAQDWVSMLMRMYTRYCERAGYKVEVMDYLAGDEAGVKSVTLGIEGINAYGYLKSEKGVHRLVRISPFDTNGRRHTSFASVDVLPQVEYDDEVEIDPDDLRVDTYRSSGKGGQHLNKTDSAVRITHLPTGIVVQCQDERSQHSNRDKAMRLLRAQLLQRKLQDQEKELAELRGDQQEIGWGSQIRSYVFQPYRLIKDHRTGAEMGNIEAVMDGELDSFIAAYLQKYRRRD